MVNVAILGHGVVGSGTVEVLKNKSEQLKVETGETINIKYILVRHDYDVPYKDKFVTDFSVIESDKSVDLIVEAIGGTVPAYDYVKRRLLAGKDVVTSNKELVAKHGVELMTIADEENVNFMFEAAVGGAVPVIHSVRNCLQANKVTSFSGILNGTTNYILTKMIDEGLSFDTALKQAQELGYAEADPSADVDGIDTCRKTCILTDIITDTHIMPEKVHTEGIRNVRIKDVDILKTIGGHVKLLGNYQSLANGKCSVIVAPFVVFNQGILFAANDVFNALQLETDNAGLMAFYGRGAGNLPTASAVVNDIVECVNSGGTIYAPWNDENDDMFVDYRDVQRDFYVNLNDDFGKIKRVFPNSELIYDNVEKAVIIRNCTERQLDVKLNNFTVNSVLRILK